MLVANNLTEIKTAARTATRYLASQGIKIGHSQALDMVARMTGNRNHMVTMAKQEKTKKKPCACKKCGSDLLFNYCVDETCFFSDWTQNVDYDFATEHSRPEIERRFGVQKRMPVCATITDDDNGEEMSFHADAWFAQASESTLRKLWEKGWSRCQIADDVAYFYEHADKKLGSFFRYVQSISAGFEVTVDADDAVEWMRHNRTGIWAQEICAEHSIDLAQCDGSDPSGLWGWRKDADTFSQYEFECIEACAIDAVEQLGLAVVPPIVVGTKNTEVLPGATASEVVHVQIQDLVGEYDKPESVGEWAWIEQHASFSHKDNGTSGGLEFVLNLSLTFDNIPEKLLATIRDAKQRHIAYLIFHQGT